MDMADAKSAWTISYGHILSSIEATSCLQVCNSPESFLRSWSMLSEHAGLAGGTRELMLPEQL